MKIKKFKLYSHLKTKLLKLSKKICFFPVSNSNSVKKTIFKKDHKPLNDYTFFLLLSIVQLLLDIMEYITDEAEIQDYNRAVIIINSILLLFAFIICFKKNKKVLVIFSSIKIFVEFHFTLSHITSNQNNICYTNFVLSFFYAQYIILLTQHTISYLTEKTKKIIIFIIIELYFLVFLVYNFNENYILIFKIFIILDIIIMIFFYSERKETISKKKFLLKTQKPDSEKKILEEILNFINNGILILDLNEIPNILYENKKFKEIFNLKKEELKYKNIEKKIQFISEKITKKKNDELLIDEIKRENLNQTIETFKTFSQFFINLKEQYQLILKEKNSKTIIIQTIDNKKIEIQIKAFQYLNQNSLFFYFSEINSEENSLHINNMNSNNIEEDFVNWIKKFKEPVCVISTVFNKIITKIKVVNEKIEMKDLYPAICSVNYQLNLFKNYLDVLYIQTNEIIINIQNISLNSFLDDLNNYFNSFSEIRNISFTTDYDYSLQLIIKSDEKILKQIIYSLIDNSLTNITSGFLKVKISLKQKQNKIKFSVKDTGCGFTLEKSAKIKEILQNPDFSKRFNDIYLNNINEFKGLILIQNLILLLNNSDPYGLIIKSKENEGSKFSFYLDFTVNNDDDEIINQKSYNNESISNELISNYFIDRKILEKFKILRKSEFSKIYELNESIIPTNNDNSIESGAHKISTDYDKYYNKFSDIQASVKNNRNNHYHSKNKNETNFSFFGSNSNYKDYLSEDILIINTSYFYMFSLESLMKKFDISFAKFFNINNALNSLKNKYNQNNSEFYKLIFIELSSLTSINLKNIKQIIELMENNIIRYIPIIGYGDSNSSSSLIKLKKIGLNDIIFLPIEENSFKEILTKWIK